MGTTAIKCKCETWFNQHATDTDNRCKPCRRKAATKSVRRTQRRSESRPEFGSAQWAESRGGLIGGYETD